MISVPNEEIGYLASEEYTSRTTSPRPPTSTSLHRPRTSESQTYAESPLREASFPINDLGRSKDIKSPESAVENEDDVVHIDPPSHPGSKIHGGGYDPPTEDLGPHGGNTEEQGGWIVEKGEGVPILASDEVAKNPEAEYMQPAVSPEQEKRGSSYHAGVDSEVPLSYQSGWRSSSRPTSRPSSRPSSLHGAPNSLSRFLSHEELETSGTPLEEIEEYEPLFPEDEKDEAKKKPATQVDKLKRPDLARHHFPSRDVWEDTPSSLQLQTTVKSPQLPEENPAMIETNPSKVFEPPEVEHSRKGDAGQEDRAAFLPDQAKQFAKRHFKPDVLEDLGSAGGRPGLQRRFPSQDIWEDSPSSSYLETTVKSPQVKDEAASPPEVTSAGQEKGKPIIPERPARSKPGEFVTAEKVEHKDVLPTEKKPPTIPDRPKPAVPARPAKHITKADNETGTDNAPLTKTASVGSDTSNSSATMPEKVNVAKIKPAPPARPAAGSKIAALKAGFMSDLQNKLSLGPQQVKKQEEDEAAAAKEAEEKEKQPLSDARKGRARGPQRRKPASSSASATTDVAESKSVFSLAIPTTIWSIDADHGALDVPAHAAAEALEATMSKPRTLNPPSMQASPASKPVSDQPTPRSEKSDPFASHPTLLTTVPPAATSGLANEVEPASEAPSRAQVQSSLDGEDEPEATNEPTVKDETTQTGETEMVIGSSHEGAAPEKLTAFIGGRAPEEGTVVVSGEGKKEGEGEREASPAA